MCLRVLQIKAARAEDRGSVLAAHANPQQTDPGQLIGVGKVAELLDCSQRTVYRLADCGRLPRPRKVGRLVRWSVGEIRDWVENGCPKQDHRR